MGAIGLLLLAVGAILYWGVSGDAGGFDGGTIGLILMVVGLIGLILSVFRGTFLTVRREQVVDHHVVDEHHHRP
jgi:hypothetical protein